MKIRNYSHSLILVSALLSLLSPKIITADPISITTSTPDTLNISSQAEYRYRGTAVVGCSDRGLEKVRKLEWHTNPIPNTLRVRKTNFGNWLRFTFKNETGNDVDKRLVFFSTNLSRIEFCAFSSEGRFERDFYVQSEDKNFRGYLVPRFPSFPIRLRSGETKTFYYYFYSTEDITYANFPVKVQGQSTMEKGESVRGASVIFIFLLTIFTWVLGMIYWIRRKKAVFPALHAYILISLFFFYFLHIKSFALFWGVSGRITEYPYFLFQTVSYISLFPFFLSVERIWNGKQKGNWISLSALLFGFSFLLIPVSEPVFEYRILILAGASALTIYFFIKSHRSILGSGRPTVIVYLFSWTVFFLLNSAKSLYHFDFYPYNEIAIFSVVFLLLSTCLFRIIAYFRSVPRDIFIPNPPSPEIERVRFPRWKWGA